MTEIDIEQFEGHTPAPWKNVGYTAMKLDVWSVDGVDNEVTHDWRPIPSVDHKLAAAAPDLLEEVKRLRENMASDYRHHAKLITKCENECTCGASEVFADGY